MAQDNTLEETGTLAAKTAFTLGFRYSAVLAAYHCFASIHNAWSSQHAANPDHSDQKLARTSELLNQLAVAANLFLVGSLLRTPKPTSPGIIPSPTACELPLMLMLSTATGAVALLSYLDYMMVETHKTHLLDVYGIFMLTWAVANMVLVSTSNTEANSNHESLSKAHRAAEAAMVAPACLLFAHMVFDNHQIPLSLIFPMLVMTAGNAAFMLSAQRQMVRQHPDIPPNLRRRVETTAGMLTMSSFFQPECGPNQPQPIQGPAAADDDPEVGIPLTQKRAGGKP